MPTMNDDTIVALATAPGVSAIAVLRISGPETFRIVNELFVSKDLEKVDSHTVHLGELKESDQVLDEVLVTVFRGPRSYTREDVIEISCHGSNFVVQQIIRAMINSGARMAKPGEFTQRAFLNGRFDLAQAEAVADLIASENEIAQQAAINQMRGGFSQEIKVLRKELVHFASMIELELDFSEEDVEFASRKELRKLVDQIVSAVDPLLASFASGNVIKNGVHTVIAGKPNAGKSTLLNALLNEEKAIVSEIPGTTRDVIEDEIVIDGVHFRFIDTAGIRETKNQIEAIGVERAHKKMREAALVLYMVDLSNETQTSIEGQLTDVKKLEVPFIIIGNKTDIAQSDLLSWGKEQPEWHIMSATDKKAVHSLRTRLISAIDIGKVKTDGTVVTNTRHYESLLKTKTALGGVIKGIESKVTNDLLALDIRNALNNLGEITGDITTEDLLDNIFSKFCIGK